MKERVAIVGLLFGAVEHGVVGDQDLLLASGTE